MGSATGQEKGDRIPRVMVFLAASTPTPVLMLELPEPLLALAQPDSTTRITIRSRIKVLNTFLLVMCAPLESNKGERFTGFARQDTIHRSLRWINTFFVCYVP